MNIKGKKKKASRISKKILKYLLIAGTIYLAGSSPYFIVYLLRNVFGDEGFKKRSFTNSFSYLKSKNLIVLERDGHDIHISLTRKGRELAEKYQIEDMKIKKPKKWDGKWRVVVFDIPHDQRTKRNAFRRKLKELGFYSLQKSVWVHPYECEKEIQLLREFLGLSEKKIRIIHADRIENESDIRKVYKI